MRSIEIFYKEKKYIIMVYFFNFLDFLGFKTL